VDFNSMENLLLGEAGDEWCTELSLAELSVFGGGYGKVMTIQLAHPDHSTQPEVDACAQTHA
jgi:hypothetical protein